MNVAFDLNKLNSFMKFDSGYYNNDNNKIV